MKPVHYRRLLAATGAILLVGGTGAALPAWGSTHAGKMAAKAAPSKNLANGQTLTVTGKNFPANDPLVIVECNENVVTSASQSSCDLTNIVSVTSTGKGKVAPTPFTFHTGAIGTDGGTCDHGQKCIIAVSEASPTSTVHASVTVTVSKTASP